MSAAQGKKAKGKGRKAVAKKGTATKVPAAKGTATKGAAATNVAARTRSARGAAAEVVYRVSLADIHAHEFQVTMVVPALKERPQVRLVFPAWAPGSYLVRDFVRHVYDLKVQDLRGRPVPFIRLDKLSWQVDSGGEAFQVSYRVFGFEVSVRTAFLDESHAFWNGTNLFFLVEGEEVRPCRVEVDPVHGGWKVATPLSPVTGRRHTFRARHFDELVDSPFEVGTHTLQRFTVRGTVFEVAFVGSSNADRERLLRELAQVVAATGAMFGGFPFDRYLFIVQFLPSAQGGLEHHNSATLQFSAHAFEDEKGYERFALLAAHEFFHAWNVKRIHDVVLGPFDYTRENYTRLLWFHEGFTEYMAHVILLRAGLWTPEQFLRFVADAWPRYIHRPGRNVVPLAELSFEAWIKEYKPAENHLNRSVSYYEKGMWAGLVLDLLLREKSQGAAGLPDLFRRLWDQFGRPGRGITEDDIRAVAAPFTGSAINDFFERYVHGRQELPVPEMLRKAGLTVEEMAPWASAKGREKDADGVKRRRQQAWTGVVLGGPVGGSNPGDRAMIRNVIPQSPAWRAGLTFGDEVVAVDGHRVNGATFAARVGDRRPGDTMEVAYFRREKLRQTRITLMENPERRFQIGRDPRASDRAARIRAAWLGEPPPSSGAGPKAGRGPKSRSKAG